MAFTGDCEEDLRTCWREDSREFDGSATRPVNRTSNLPGNVPFDAIFRPGQVSPKVSTWYLLVELKGISATFLFFSLMSLTEPDDSSMHFSRADSEASPATSRCEGRSQ